MAEGRYAATAEELSELTGVAPRSLYGALARLMRDGRLFSPARGLYVPVPPDYRTWGAVPADWFVDAMMRHLKRSYYVAFLSAAALHGAAHQAPQVFQVMTTKPLPDRDFGRVRLRFTASRLVDKMDTERQLTHTGHVVVATRETTAVDLAWRPKAGGGLSNVATVLKELGDLDGDRLARLAQLRGRAVARRLGWLLSRFRVDVDVHWLRTIAEPGAGEATLLSPRGPRRGSVDREWGILVNAPVEPDV